MPPGLFHAAWAEMPPPRR